MTALDPVSAKRTKVTKFDLLDYFTTSWIDFNRERLDSTLLDKEDDTAFKILLDDFQEYVRYFMIDLAVAIHKNQGGSLTVEYRERIDKNTWKKEFFGKDIETTLLREASPLTKNKNRYRFMYDALYEYYRYLGWNDHLEAGYDSDSSDDDDDDDDSSPGGGSSSQSGMGGSTEGNNDSTSKSSNSTSRNDRPNRGKDCSSRANDSSVDNNGSAWNANSIARKRSGSGRGDDDSDGDKDDRRRRMDTPRPLRRGNKRRRRKCKADLRFGSENYLGALEVLSLFVERAQSDELLQKRLYSTIKKAKSSNTPSLAAANAITTLYMIGKRFQGGDLNGVCIPTDYILDEAREFLEDGLIMILEGYMIKQKSDLLMPEEQNIIAKDGVVPSYVIDERMGFNEEISPPAVFDDVTPQATKMNLKNQPRSYDGDVSYIEGSADITIQSKDNTEESTSTINFFGNGDIFSINTLTTDHPYPSHVSTDKSILQSSKEEIASECLSIEQNPFLGTMPDPVMSIIGYPTSFEESAFNIDMESEHALTSISKYADDFKLQPEKVVHFSREKVVDISPDSVYTKSDFIQSEGLFKPVFKINSTLPTLNLDNNSIGSSGAQALSEALKTNSTLTTLNLENNSIGDSGAQALSEALKTNSTLTI
ncbi:hypothetical protein FBU30_007028 [Linnemannia zychae]|nr:hypothetical protein FBU30_007028 [Linnemannia zychae]